MSTQSTNFEAISAPGGGLIKAWNRGVQFEEAAIKQLINTSSLPFVKPWVAAMPDCHWGNGSTVGSVVPTEGAICPAAVGVDIGCGMTATRLEIDRQQLTESPASLRVAIEQVVPSGRSNNGALGDIGAWDERLPDRIREVWADEFEPIYTALCADWAGMKARNTVNHLGTLGTGNHFIELSTDESGKVWVVLHSGSRGPGNRIGGFFTQLAKRLCEKWFIHLPDADLAYLVQDTVEFDAYLYAVKFAQRFALRNRELMMDAILGRLFGGISVTESVNCHHNYISWERHFGKNLMITRKGAVRAGQREIGIIPGSMGSKSYIVRGKGNRDSFTSCSHGAGRAMSRHEAVKRFTVEDHAKATEGVECYKGAEVLDETPGAYKDIDAVMEAQNDLVEIVHTLKQFVCVKGRS